MIRPWESFNPLGEAPLRAHEKAKLGELSCCWLNSDLSSEEKLALEDSLRTLRHIFSMVSLMEVEISSSTATLSWATLVPRKFCDMVEERCPQALVLIAVYCILLKRLEELWWIRGKAENLLEKVKSELSDELWKWIQWPMAVIEGNAKDDEIYY